MEIQRLREEDIHHILQLCNYTLEPSSEKSNDSKYYENYNNDPEEYHTLDRNFPTYVRFCINAGYAFVAVEDGFIVGIVLAYERPDFFRGRCIFIELLGVLPRYQRRGYAKRLLEKVAKTAKENGISYALLSAVRDEDYYEMYKHLGFEDQLSDTTLMSKRI